MNTRRSRPYLAQSFPPEISLENESEAGECAAGMQPADAAEYIAALLCSLRAIATDAQLPLLSDLISAAEEEARLHCRM